MILIGSTITVMSRTTTLLMRVSGSFMPFEYLKLSGDKTTFGKFFVPRAGRLSMGIARARGPYRHGPFGQPDHAGRPDHAAYLDGCQDRRDRVHAPSGKSSRDQRAVVSRLVPMGEMELAATVSESFRRTFGSTVSWAVRCGRWVPQRPGGAPDQIFAVSLANSPLTDGQQQAVVRIGPSRITHSRRAPHPLPCQPRLPWPMHRRPVPAR